MTGQNEDKQHCKCFIKDLCLEEERLGAKPRPECPLVCWRASLHSLGTAIARKPTEDFIFYQEATRYWVKAEREVALKLLDRTVGPKQERKAEQKITLLPMQIIRHE
jgi:hypothetical protein